MKFKLTRIVVAFALVVIPFAYSKNLDNSRYNLVVKNPEHRILKCVKMPKKIGEIVKIPFACDSGTLSLKVVDNGKKVLFDSNFDGKFDKKDGKGVGINKKVLLKYKNNGAGETYPVTPIYVSARRVYFLINQALFTTIAGKEYYFCDANLNGKFADVGIDAIVIGKSRMETKLTKYISIDKDIYSVSIDEKSRVLTLHKYDGEVTEFLLTTDSKKCHKQILLQEKTGKFAALVDANSSIKMVPGDYNIMGGVYVETDRDFSDYDFSRCPNMLSLFNINRGGMINVAGKKQCIKSGKPNEMIVKILRVSKNKIIVKKVELQMSDGSTTHARNCFKKNKQALTVWFRLNGKEKQITTLEYG